MEVSQTFHFLMLSYYLKGCNAQTNAVQQIYYVYTFPKYVLEDKYVGSRNLVLCQ